MFRLTDLSVKSTLHSFLKPYMTFIKQTILTYHILFYKIPLILLSFKPFTIETSYYKRGERFMIKDNQKLLNKFLILFDLVLFILSFYLAFWLKFDYYSPLSRLVGIPVFGYPPIFRSYAGILFILVPIYLLAYQCCNLYGPKRARGKRAEIGNILKANIIMIFIFATALFFTKQQEVYSRWFMAYFFIVNVIFSVLFRMSLRIILNKFRRKGYNLKHILLVGYSRAAETFIDHVNRSPEWGYCIHGIADDTKPIGYTYKGIPVITTSKGLPQLLAKNKLDEIAITLSLDEYSKLEHIVSICEKSGVHTKFIPDYNRIIPTKPYTEDMNGLPVINIRHVPLSNFTNKLIKRVFDIVGSLCALVIFSIPMLIIAIIIKTTSKGPLIFSQVRVGLHNREFKMYKFRSMREQTAESEKKAWTVKDDPRITPIGKFIRKTSIDELPQLFNVLKGDMSLVGPRPERPYFVEKFKEEIPRYMIKHQVRPGMSGWAQVNGYRGDTSIRRRIDYDLYYIENWTIGLDIKILFLTVFNGFINKNAY